MGEKCRLYVDLIVQHSEVTGSCFLMVVKVPGNKQNIKVVVDCGLFQEKKYEELNEQFNFNADEVKAVLLTHAHMDHVGRVPKLVKEGFQGYIFCTNDTATLLPDALSNGYKVLKKNAKLRHKPSLLLYSEGDINDTLQRMRPIEYFKQTQICENIKVTFIPNGHLVGASMILVDVYDYDDNHIYLLFTGDYNNHNVFLDKHVIPEEIFEKPVNIITESTYGTTNACEEEEKIFEKNIIKAIEGNKEIIIPAFALGRSQEVLYILKRMQDDKKLPLRVPIYLDGNLAIRYTSIYKNGDLDIKDTMIDFLPKNFTCVESDEQRNKLLTDNKCKIIVTTSGMAKHGPARVYIPNAIEKENALIHFTGYCAEGTLGRILKETQNREEIMLGGLLVTKKADIEFTSEFSSHAKADEIIELLNQFNKKLSVIVNHGREETKKEFAKKVYSDVKVKKVGIIDSGTIFRIGEYGIVKTITVYDR